MKPLTRIAAEYLATLPLTVRLRANAEGPPVEVKGAGYKPVTPPAVVGEFGLDYPDPVLFRFTDKLGYVPGWYATVGDEVVHDEIWPAPDFIGGPGDTITINLSGIASE